MVALHNLESGLWVSRIPGRRNGADPPEPGRAPGTRVHEEYGRKDGRVLWSKSARRQFLEADNHSFAHHKWSMLGNCLSDESRKWSFSFANPAEDRHFYCTQCVILWSTQGPLTGAMKPPWWEL